MVAKLDSRTEVKVGDELELALEMSETHIFDGETKDKLV